MWLLAYQASRARRRCNPAEAIVLFELFSVLLLQKRLHKTFSLYVRWDTDCPHMHTENMDDAESNSRYHGQLYRRKHP